MRNTILLLTLTLLFSFNLTGCSLFSSSDEESETATVAEEQVDGGESEELVDDEFASDDFEEGDDAGADFGEEETQVADQVEDSFGDEVEGDEYPDDDYALDSDSSMEVSSDDFIDDNSFDTGESLAIDEGDSLPDAPMVTNEEEDLFGSDSEPVVDDTPTAIVDNSYSAPVDDYMEPVSDVPNFVSVKKMKPAAYRRAGANINRLYVARSGDDMQSIAQKLYGSDRSADLYEYNSHFKGKSLKVGDKVYYESPNNKNDQTMLTYYEDNNVSPQYYTSEEGDNIRAISKKLLGHERSWMEIYATNENVNSKGRLPAGIQFRYWPEGSTPMAVAKMEKPPEVTMPDPEPVEEVVEEVAVNEPEEMAEPEEVKLDEPQEVAQLEEPKPMNDPMNGEDEINPPPAVGSTGEPPKAIAPPPPPPPPPAPSMRPKFNKPPPPTMAMDEKSDMPLAGIGEDSTIMAAIGGLLILAFIIMLIIIRRSRSKRVNFSQTQV